MKRYRVEGAGKETGRDMAVVIEAVDAEEATASAQDRGILVSKVEEAPPSLWAMLTTPAPLRASALRAPKIRPRFMVLGFVAGVLQILGAITTAIGIFIAVAMTIGVRESAASVDSEVARAMFTVTIASFYATAGAIIVGGLVMIAIGGIIEILRAIECNVRG